MVDKKNIQLQDIIISPRAIALNEVKITSKEDPAREKNLDLFKSRFLGNSQFAKVCKIINPEILDLIYNNKTQTLTAKSGDFLVIENRALGYRVKYLLTDFIFSNSDDGSGYFFYSGSVLFEQLQGSPAEQEQWSKRRNEIYNNSLAHFLRSAMRNHLDADGFKVYRFLVDHTRPSDSLVNAKLKYFNLIKGQGSYRDSLAFWKKVQKSPKLLANQTAVALTGEDVVAKTKSPGVYRFGCEKDALYVLRGRRPEKTSVLLNHLQDPNNSSETLITFDQPEAYFDRNGAILNPGCMTFMGAWAKNGIADLLPVNFEPEGKQKDLEVDSVVLTKVEKSLNGLELSRRLEKTYLHFDKPYYAAGDTIYFKAYVTDPLNQLSSLSKILHVDFIGPIGTIEQSIQLRLNDGLAAGDLALPETIGGGYYRVRAYTNLMRNYDQDFFFDKHIYIANSVVSSVPAGRLPKKTDNAERTISNTMSKSKIDSRLCNAAPITQGLNRIIASPIDGDHF
jgi:hypothetical protein